MRVSTRLTYVPASADAATRAAASIDVTLEHDPVVSYLGFLLNESGSSAAHAASAQRRARAVIRRMKAEYGGRAIVTIGQATLMWQVHGRGVLEWPSGAIPPGGARYADRKQEEALRAILGRSCASNVAYDALLLVFSMWSIAERILRGRARYAYDFSRTRRRPGRKALFDALMRRLDSPGFAAASVTGAVDGALAELGIAEWPYVAECDGAGDDSDAADAAAEKRAWRSRVDKAMEPVVRDRIVRYLTFSSAGSHGRGRGHLADRGRARKPTTVVAAVRAQSDRRRRRVFARRAPERRVVDGAGSRAGPRLRELFGSAVRCVRPRERGAPSSLLPRALCGGARVPGRRSPGGPDVLDRESTRPLPQARRRRFA